MKKTGFPRFPALRLFRTSFLPHTCVDVVLATMQPTDRFWRRRVFAISAGNIFSTFAIFTTGLQVVAADSAIWLMYISRLVAVFVWGETVATVALLAAQIRYFDCSFTILL